MVVAPLRLITVLLIFVVPVPSLADGGGDSAGGGSTVRCQEQSRPFLLDRLSRNPKLADEKDVVVTAASKPTIPSNEQPEISELFESDRTAFQLAMRRLQDWELKLSDKQAASKALMRILGTTIHGTSYKRTTHSFNVVARYKLDDSLHSRCRDIKTAILYLQNHGCLISAPAWDSLDVETQAGLIVHEALRQIQGLHGLHDLTDEQLQMITAQIMDGVPSGEFTFEPWMSKKLARLCVVTAAAKRACSSCGIKELKNEEEVDRLYAKIAIITTNEVDSVLDKNQEKRSNSLLVPESFRRLLNDLIERGILKR